MKKPNKFLVLAYIIWCVINLFLAVYSLIDDGWYCFGDEFFPLGSTRLFQYDLTELVVYCGIPLLIYWLYCNVEEKYY